MELSSGASVDLCRCCEVVEIGEDICAVELSSGASIDLCSCCKVVEIVEETGTFDVLCNAVELCVELHHDVVGLGCTEEELEAVDCEAVEQGIVECCGSTEELEAVDCEAMELGIVECCGGTEELEAVDCEVVDRGIVECCCNTAALLGLCIEDLAEAEEELSTCGCIAVDLGTIIAMIKLSTGELEEKLALDTVLAVDLSSGVSVDLC